MNGFYTIVDVRTDSDYQDWIPVAILFYNPLRHKVYVRNMVDMRLARDLRVFIGKFKYYMTIENFTELTRSSEGLYQTRTVDNCKILSRPGRTLDAICKKHFG